MNNEFTMSLTSNLGSTSEKIGVTSTMKEQSENIQVTIEHFKKCLDSQKKQQQELSIQLSKLQKSTEDSFKEMLNEVKFRCRQVGENYRHDSDKHQKESEYLALQERILDEEHSKLRDLSQDLGGRASELMDSVGV